MPYLTKNTKRKNLKTNLKRWKQYNKKKLFIFKNKKINNFRYNLC